MARWSIAAITSCTNTSNPGVMVAAGLVAKQRRRAGAAQQAVGEDDAVAGFARGDGLLRRGRAHAVPLAKLGFHLTGYGCMTCIGASGSLTPELADSRQNLAWPPCCPGNRNFEGRIQPDVRLNYLASPPLVVAYALAGTVDTDLTTEPIGVDPDGDPVYLRDIWPTSREIDAVIASTARPRDVRQCVRRRVRRRRAVAGACAPSPADFDWAEDSTYLRRPPYFDGMALDRRRCRTSSTHGRWPCSATRSPPTTSRRPERSRRTAWPGGTCERA